MPTRDEVSRLLDAEHASKITEVGELATPRDLARLERERLRPTGCTASADRCEPGDSVAARPVRTGGSARRFASASSASSGASDFRPTGGRGWRGRAQTFVWQLVGPPLATQQQFNTTTIDHLNRQITTERTLVEKTSTIATTLQQALEDCSASSRFSSSI
jgi:hypothetical protein